MAAKGAAGGKEHGVPLSTLKECLEFLEWLKTNKHKQRQTASNLYERIKKYYKRSNVQHDIEKSLSQFLTNVSNFYKRLCYVRVAGNYNDKTAAQIVDALLDCLPRFIAALHYLWYDVNATFEQLGGGGWKNDYPGAISSYWYSSYGGDLDAYLHAQPSNKYGGLMPGGFTSGDVRYNEYYDGYRQGFNMAPELGVILNASQHNYFRDVLVISFVSNSNTHMVNSANVLALVGTFCDIVETDPSGAKLKKVVQKKDTCIKWDELKRHCATVKSLVHKIFRKEAFDHTGQSPKSKDINVDECAKFAANWLRTHLGTVRDNLQKIKTDHAAVNAPSKNNLGEYLTENLYPYGFILEDNHFKRMISHRNALLQQHWRAVLAEFIAPDKGLAKLKKILEGEKCPDLAKPSSDAVARNVQSSKPSVTTGGGGVQISGAQQKTTPESSSSVTGKGDAPKTEAKKPEAAKPTAATTATPSPGGKPNGGPNRGTNGKGQQNQGSGNQGVSNQNSGKNAGKPTTSSVTTSPQTPSRGNAGAPGQAGTTGDKGPQGHPSTGSTTSSPPQQTVISQKTLSPSPPQPVVPPQALAPPTGPPAAPGSAGQPGDGGGSQNGGGDQGQKAARSPSSVQSLAPSGASTVTQSSSASGNSGGKVSASVPGQSSGQGLGGQRGGSQGQQTVAGSQSVNTQPSSGTSSGPGSPGVPAPIPSDQGSTSSTTQQNGRGTPQVPTTATTTTSAVSGAGPGGGGNTYGCSKPITLPAEFGGGKYCPRNGNYNQYDKYYKTWNDTPLASSKTMLNRHVSTLQNHNASTSGDRRVQHRHNYGTKGMQPPQKGDLFLSGTSVEEKLDYPWWFINETIERPSLKGRVAPDFIMNSLEVDQKHHDTYKNANDQYERERTENKNMQRMMRIVEQNFNESQKQLEVAAMKDAARLKTSKHADFHVTFPSPRKYYDDRPQPEQSDFKLLIDPVPFDDSIDVQYETNPNPSDSSAPPVLFEIIRPTPDDEKRFRHPEPFDALVMDMDPFLDPSNVEISQSPDKQNFDTTADNVYGKAQGDVHLQIDIPKRPLQDSIRDVNLDDPYANADDIFMDEFRNGSSLYVEDKGFSGIPQTNFDLDFAPERIGNVDYEDPGIPRDPSREVSARGVALFPDSNVCTNPWYVPSSTTSITHPPLSPPPVSDHLPPPQTVREMLCWFVGLNTQGYIGLISEHFKSILMDINKDTSQPTDAFDVTGDPYQLTASHVTAKLTETCLYSATVIYRIKYKDISDAFKDFFKDPDKYAFYYASDPACLLCQLRDYVYACCHQLEFLKAQCKRDKLSGGWKNCEYGSDIKSPKSPLQAFLTDGWDSDFETHPFDPCNICLKSRIRMGFRMEDLPKTSQLGSVISTILTPSCGGSDPLLTLSSYLNCLTRRTPRTTGELVSYFHHFGNSLHDTFTNKLLSLGESLSSPHLNCPDWDRLGASDLDTVRGIRGHESIKSIYNSNHDEEHPRTLSTLVGCGSDSSHCHRHLSPITYRAYALYSQQFAHTYLSWTVYLPDRLWESLEKLYNDLKKHDYAKCSSLHQCADALPLLYLHGFTPPEGQSQLTVMCSDVMAKLQEIANGGPIADLMTAMDNFLYRIREPFIYTLVALWSLAFLIFANTMLYRIDVLHIRSHLIRTKASHLIDVKALLSDNKKMMSLYDANYFDDDPNELLNLR